MFNVLKYMMGVTAPGQVRITQKHFTPTCDKGHPPYQQVLTPDLSYTTPPPWGKRRTSYLPSCLSPPLSILQGSGPSSGIFQKCSLCPLNSQRAPGLHLFEVRDHLPPQAHGTCQRLEGAGSRRLVVGYVGWNAGDTYPSPSPTHNEHLIKMKDWGCWKERWRV